MCMCMCIYVIDLESAARDIFRDRSYAHTFKVRGPTYFIGE